MKPRSVPYWDEDTKRENHHWFVTDASPAGSWHDFALVAPADGGWRAKLINEIGFADERVFPSLSEAKDWVELTYALEK